MCGLAGRTIGLADAGVLVCPPPSGSRRGQGNALEGAAGSVTNSALSLGGAASRCAALLELVAPSGTRGMGNPAAVKRL